MRLSSFLVGAAVGAATVVYMNRTNKTVMMGFSQLGDNMTKMMDKAMMSFADKNMSTRREKVNSPDSLDRVEALVHSDPEVQSEVNEILAQNNQTTAAAHTSAH